MQLDVLAHQCNGAGLAAGGNAGDHLLPLGQVGRGNIQVQLLHHHIVRIYDRTPKHLAEFLSNGGLARPGHADQYNISHEMKPPVVS